ncbi:MAG TPA: WD40 repeat domain-containing protein [Terriglobales bacterium]|nr:WD40 repeat domain-containing protein [Terriglobales bacterium]
MVRLSRRIGVARLATLLVLITLGLSGCHKGTGTAIQTYPPAASVTLAPANAVSLELGTDTAFTASVFTANHTASTQPVNYQSSNTSVVTVAANGLACAGTWDSLVSPSVCTPGPVGVAQVIATAQGVSSAPTTIYVHQHIDQVTIKDICAVTVPPAPCSVPRLPGSTCQSLNANSIPQNTVYEAHAFSQGTDITPTVGQFGWNAVNGGVTTFDQTVFGLNNMVNGVSLNQVQATAKAPGVTPVYAAIGTANSPPINFTTCLVESIQMQLTEATSTSQTFAPTVTDTAGNIIMAPASQVTVPLTWSSSAPGSISVSTAGVATGSTPGTAATIVASCTPPTCNIGLLPTQPIYPKNAEEMMVQGSGGTGPATATVYVGSTACGTTDNCISAVIPISVPANAPSSPVMLPFTPDSMVPDRQGNKVYMGTDSSFLNTAGLMVLATSGSSITHFTSTPGKVLAVSPDGTTLIVSDTVDVPNQVFVFNTSTNVSTPFVISGATAADFSPDSLKAYIVAGSTLYVYSKLDGLKSVPLTAPANDVAFFAEGAFAYLAGGNPSGVTVYRTCDNGAADFPSMPATPTLIGAVPDAQHMFTVNPPTVSVIGVSAAPSGCTPTVSDVVTNFDLGQGTFTASQLIISPSGSTAYILSPNLKSILVFNIAGETATSITMAGNATPLRAAITPDGTLLVVGGSDGLLHIIQTASNADTQQISFTSSFCQNASGQPFGITCNPNLVAVKP